MQRGGSAATNVNHQAWFAASGANKNNEMETHDNDKMKFPHTNNRSLMPSPTAADGVYNYAVERPTNDKGWRLAFTAILAATTLFGFVALFLEGGERIPGGREPYTTLVLFLQA